MASTTERTSTVTDAQRDLLRSAVREGYFEVPRRTTLVDLAAKHDLSDREASERLRRGLDGLVRDVILDEDPGKGRMSDDPAADGSVGLHRDPESIDRAFEALRHPHRRRILTALAGATPRDVALLASEECRPDDADPDRFATQLHHAHLPKLAAAGYVDWDRDDGTIRAGPAFDEVEPVLRLLSDHGGDLPDG